MKKWLAISIALILLLGVLPGLGEAGAGIPDELVGQWKGQGAPTYGGISTIDLTVTVNADGTGTGEYTCYEGSFNADYPFSISYDDSSFSVDIPTNATIASCEGTWALADGELKLRITGAYASGTSYYYTASCKKVDAAQDDAAEAYALAEAGEPVRLGDLALEPQLFTDAYESWDLLAASTSDPFPAHGEVYLVRFAVAEGGEALTPEQIEEEIAPTMSLYSESEGSASRIFQVVTPDDQATKVFDILFYCENSYTLEDLDLLCDGALYPLDGLPTDGEKLPGPTEYELACAALNPLYERAKGDKGGSDVTDTACAGRLIAAIYFSSGATEPSLISADTEHYPIPDALKPYLAQSIEEADVAAIIYPTYSTVGFYSAGGAAEETTTWMTLFDLNTGEQYDAIRIAVNQPPQTISVPVINGVTMPGGASGAFEDGKALEQLAELAETAAAAPEPAPEPTPEPTEEPTPEPTEEPTPETIEAPAPQASGKTPVDDVLDALNDDIYRATYDALLSGEVIQKGSKGDTAKGVQQTLVALGQDIAVDGNVGPKTIAALNAVQAAFGLPETESLDAEVYATLLPRLLIVTDPDAADALLMGSMDAAEYDYLRACALVAQGKYASARALFEESGWGDWAARAEACVQPWPKTGVLYKNPEVKGSSAELAVQFNTEADTAMLVKVYTEGGVLARTMFIGGTGKATCSLPAGTYVIKDGVGKNWYGEEEAFGERPEGQYEIMTFEGGSQEVELKKNYRSTITVNVQEDNPAAEGVGSDWESWSDF